jgi:thioredoxin-like negative regulator of GroEL
VFDADGPEIKQGKLADLELFAEARAIYSQENFAETARLFSECWRHNQGVSAAKIYWERCQSALVTRTKIKDRLHYLD